MPFSIRLPIFATLLLLANVSQAADKRPNIIVIYTDDHGFTDLSAQGIRNDIKTPHIDALAEGGVRMTSGYSTAPQCVPSRAGLLSGRYQNRFGVESNGQPLTGFNAQVTIAQRLKKAGYATGMTGKWHLGPAPEIVNHGFDDVYYKNANRPGWANFDLDGASRPGGKENSKLYHLDANSAAACAFIERHHQQPFFFYCAYRAPHVPLDAPPEYLKRFPGKMPQRRRQALAMLSAVDDGVGRIMATLRKHKLEERTLIFIIGDNGAPLKIHKVDAPGGGPGWDGSLNEPLNGEKGMLSEGGIRVPFLVYWKGEIAGGRLFHHPVIALDVAATALALSGQPASKELDGVNLIPFLKAEQPQPPHKEIYWRWIAQAAVRQGDWKYLRAGAREYLFDLSKDREEKHNLLKANPELADRLRNKLQNWAGQLQPPGLQTKAMSSTWETYYDHYFDGKPAPKRDASRPRGAAKGKAAALQGWVVRGGTGMVKNGALHVKSAQPKQRTFIAAAGIKAPAKFTVRLAMQCDVAGPGSISWREQGQKDFQAEQSAAYKCAKSEDVQQQSVTINASRPVIHLRIVLPAGGARIQSIGIEDAAGNPVKQWKF